MIMEKRKQGFAALDPDKQRKIASKGGVVDHKLHRSHDLTSQEAAEAGRRGAAAREKNRKAAMPY
jgi:general stress protein YciG